MRRCRVGQSLRRVRRAWSSCLPEAAAYVRRLEELIGCEFHLISTGPHRDETIMLKPMI